MPQSDIAIMHLLIPLGDPPANNILWSPVDPNKILVSAGYSDFSGGEIYVFDTIEKEKQIIATSRRGFLGIRTWLSDGKTFIMSVNSATDGFEDDGLWMADVTDRTFSYLQSETDQIILGPNKNSLTINRTRNTPSGIKKTEIVWVNILSYEENLVYETEPGQIILGFSWSPEKMRLAFSMGDAQLESNFDIYIFDMQSKNITQITFDGDNTYPVWSPTGDLIAYRKEIHNKKSESFSLNLINADGACNIKMIDSDYILPPSWSPDGTQIAFIMPNLDGIYVADITRFLEGNYINLCERRQ